MIPRARRRNRALAALSPAGWASLRPAVAGCQSVHVPVALRPVSFVVLVLFVRLFVVVLGLRSSIPLLFDLAVDEFGEIVEGFLNLGGRNVFLQRGLKEFIRP